MPKKSKREKSKLKGVKQHKLSGKRVKKEKSKKVKTEKKIKPAAVAPVKKRRRYDRGDGLRAMIKAKKEFELKKKPD